LWRSWEEKQ